MDQAASYQKEYKALHKTVHFHSTLKHLLIHKYIPHILDKRKINISSVKCIAFVYFS